MKLRSLLLYARGKRLEESDFHGIDAVRLMEPAENAEELAAGPQNLRAVPRFEVDVDAHLLLVSHGLTLPCHIVDLSLGGCQLCTRERFPARAGVRVEVTFKVRGLAFRFSAIAQWTDGRNLVGIRFVDVSARRKEEFLEAIAEVEAENTAKLAAEKEVADQDAAAMRAAEEPSAALEAAAAPVAQCVEQTTQPLSAFPAPAEEIASRVPPELRKLSIVLRAPGLNSDLDAPGPAAQPSPGTRKPSEAQRVDPQFAGPALVRSSGRERRTQSREGVDTSAVIHLINVASRLTGRILDLSVGGCRIRTDDRFPVGIYTRVETEFHLEGLPFRLGGVTQAIHDQRHVGIRFLDMSSRKREQLEQLIEEIEELNRTGNRE